MKEGGRAVSGATTSVHLSGCESAESAGCRALFRLLALTKAMRIDCKSVSL